jgi:hypothetical protein
MLSKVIRAHRPDELEHLIVELKAPTVKVGSKETTQIKKYAFAVADDARFRSVNTRWNFWVISTDLDRFAKQEIATLNLPRGMLYQSVDPTITIWVKTWAQVLNENKARLQFFQEAFEYEVDQGSALKFLQERYHEFLQGVQTEEVAEPNPALLSLESDGDYPTNHPALTAPK